VRSWASSSLLLVALAACGGEPPPPTAETPEYEEWAQRRREIPSAGFAETVRGSIDVLPPDRRVKRADDFCEIWVNGKKLHRLRLSKLPDGAYPSCSLAYEFRVGPNWLDFWDSTSNRGWRESIDTREGTRFSFTPSEGGYAFAQAKDE
jgi:hypothetical protein